MDNLKDAYDSSGFGSRDKEHNRIITAKEMLENDITEIPMLWGHFLPKIGLAVISGNSDTGKSTLMRQLSSAIVTGQEQYLGLPLRTVNNNVIYVCTEDDVTSISSRLKKEFDGISSTDPYDNFRYIFEEDYVYENLEVELNRKPADCVIIDALGDIFQGDMNNMTSVRSFFKPYKSLASRNNCLVILVAHNRKSANENAGKADVLGSQAFEAKPRVVLMLSQLSGSPLKELRISKGNFVSEELKKIKLSLQINAEGMFEVAVPSFGFSANRSQEEKYFDRIIELKEEKLSSRDIASILTAEGIKIGKSKVAEILKERIRKDDNLV